MISALAPAWISAPIQPCLNDGSLTANSPFDNRSRSGGLADRENICSSFHLCNLAATLP
jgi:hypothetical protein